MLQTTLETSVAGAVYRGVAIAPVPLPAGVGLFGSGVAALGARTRRRIRRPA